jgi:hypothetical protein
MSQPDDPWAERPQCRLGYEEDDGYQYCYAHGGFRNFYGQSPVCDRATSA